MRFGHSAAWQGGGLSPPAIPLLSAVSPLPGQLQAGSCALSRELSLCQHKPVNGLESFTTSSRFRFLLLLL